MTESRFTKEGYLFWIICFSGIFLLWMYEWQRRNPSSEEYWIKEVVAEPVNREEVK